MAAEGGLMSIPTPHMFKQESYATGGIVAFEEGGKTNKYPPLNDEQKARRDELEAIKYLDEGKKAKDNKEIETWKRGVAQTTDEFNALRAQRQAGEENPAAAKIMAARQAANAAPTDQSEFTESGGIPTTGQTVPDTRRVLSSKGHPATVNANQEQFDKGVKELTANAEREKTRLHAANVDQDSTKVVGGDTINAEVQANLDKKINMLKQSLGIKPVAGATQDVYKNEIVKTPYVPTLHQAPEGIPAALPVAPAPAAAPTGIATSQYKAPTALETQNANMAQIDMEKALRGKAGISDDPHKDTRDRMDKLEAKRAAQEAEDPFNSLMARLAAFGSSKEQTFGGGMGDSAIAGAKLSKETAALRDKQATEIIAARQAMETAEDARKRGDLTTVKAATKEAQARLEEAAKIDIQQQQANASTTQASAALRNAGVQEALIPIHQKTADAQYLTAESHDYTAHHPQANEATIKQAMVQRFMKKYGIDEEQAISRIAIAQGAGKSEISDERNLSRERLKANTDWESPMTVANARKLYGKDLPLPQLKAKFMDGRLSSLPGYTPESGSKATTEAEFIAMPKGTIYTAPDGTRRTKP
jgi:hypothetical protein